jgi:hypothetical protein
MAREETLDRIAASRVFRFGSSCHPFLTQHEGVPLFWLLMLLVIELPLIGGLVIAVCPCIACCRRRLLDLGGRQGRANGALQKYINAPAAGFRSFPSHHN